MSSGSSQRRSLLVTSNNGLRSYRQQHHNYLQQQQTHKKLCSTWTKVFFVLVISSLGLLLFVLYSDNLFLPSKGAIPSSQVSSLAQRLQKYVPTSLQAFPDVKAPSENLSSPSLHDKTGDSIEPKSSKPVVQRKRYAYAITITKDGSFQDGAAVLAYSIMKHSWQADYDISFIAFVHPNVTTSREPLRKLGYHVIEVPVPINVSAIEFDFLREKINKNGCCGAAELIKLTSYRLLQYDRIIHLDADVILLNPIDELFKLPYSLIYTTDPNMATFKKGIDKMPVQGGFIILQPSIADYRGIIHAEMNTEFRKYHGWNSSHIGWYWGGMTVQGILPYYYHRLSDPSRTHIVNRCYYNTMADTEECMWQFVQNVKSAHFTVCQKPWGCWMSMKDNVLCHDLHQTWFQYRQEAEIFYGLLPDQEGRNIPVSYADIIQAQQQQLQAQHAAIPRPVPGEEVTFNNSPPATGNPNLLRRQSFPLLTTDTQKRVCRRSGGNRYMPMELSRAVWPQEGNPFVKYTHNVKADDSADRFDPVFPESKYSQHGHYD